MTPIEALKPHLPARVYNILTRPTRFYGGPVLPAFETVEQVRAATDVDILDRRNMGPKGLDAVRAACAALHDAPPPPHQPTRGSDVEAWIKRWRDEYADRSDATSIAAYHVLDDMLDDYRLRSDTGTTLDIPADQLGPGAPGEA